MDEIKKNKKVIILCGLLILVTVVVYIVTYVNKNLNNDNTEDYKFLKKYSSNEFIPVYITEEDIAKKYLNEYKNNMLFNKEEAYNNLNKEYRETKFGSYDKYLEYLNKFTSIGTATMEVDKYSINYINGKKVFNIYDKTGNQYIIKENYIMDFEVYLDENTVIIK